jgi:hypothetical protein
MLSVFTVATLLALSQLYLFAADTDRFFAWSIDPPLSAAFMGSGFSAGFVLVVLARRRVNWADVRLSFVSVFVFAAVTLAASILHIDRFHFGRGGAAEFAAWLWLVVYVIVPVVMAVLLIRQRGTSGDDPPVRRPLPTWLRPLLALEGGAMMAVGALLFVTPKVEIWPWPLTPLVARAFAGWLIALGLAAFLAMWEGDLARLRAPSWAYVTFVVLLAIALARFGDPVEWSTPAAWVLVVWMAALLGTGVFGVWRAGDVASPTDRRRRMPGAASSSPADA